MNSAATRRATKCTSTPTKPGHDAELAGAESLSRGRACMPYVLTLVHVNRMLSWGPRLPKRRRLLLSTPKPSP